MAEVDLQGLRRKDAALLVALVQRERDRQEKPKRPPWPVWKRVWFATRWRLRRRFRRLERRGLIEPGWFVKPFAYPAYGARATPLGERTARAAVVTLMLELGVSEFEL